ncbi:MAG TPA: hypothetical protein VM347_38855, partial [Nonomuraea sp.]|nr:hypothetical protein [Nonomuraea sp.]
MVSWFKRGDKKAEQVEPQKPLPVVRFTDAARAKMLEVMEARGILGRGAVRITVQNPGIGHPDYGMALEESAEPRPDDTAIAVGELVVLVNSASLAEVDGATVDFFDDLLR